MMKTLDAKNIQLYRSHMAFSLLLFPTACHNSRWHSIYLMTYKGFVHPWLGHLRSPGIHFPGMTTPFTWPCLFPALFQQSHYTAQRCWLPSVRVAVSSSPFPASHTSQTEYLQPSNLLFSYFKILHGGLLALPPNIIISHSSRGLGTFW